MKSTAPTFYAWAIPAFTKGFPFDHTWVTTYDNRITAYVDAAGVASAGEHYWFCWGDFHPVGGTPSYPTGFLGLEGGDIAFARCLVRSNAASRPVVAARGTIINYGLDGVCHQLANQVLFATTESSPLLVRDARGYKESTGIYGDYGVNASTWAGKISICRRRISAGLAGGEMKMMDTFETLARSVIADDRVALDRLLALRQQAQDRLRALPATGGLSAAQINSLNQRFFDEAAQLLGRNGYERLFGDSPGEVTLVDPAQLAEAEQAKAAPVRASSTSVTRRTSGTSIVSTRRGRDDEESRAGAPTRATRSGKPAAKKSPGPKKKAGKKATSKKKAAPKKKAAKKPMKKKAPKKSMKKKAPKKSMKRKAAKKSMKKKAAKKSMKKKAKKK